MRRPFVWSGALAVWLLVLAMGDMVVPGAPIRGALGHGARWQEFVFATPVVAWAAGRCWCVAGSRCGDGG